MALRTFFFFFCQQNLFPVSVSSIEIPYIDATFSDTVVTPRLEWLLWL